MQVNKRVILPILICLFGALGIADAIRLSHRVKAGFGPAETVTAESYLLGISILLLVSGIAVLKTTLRANKNELLTHSPPRKAEPVTFVLIVYILYVFSTEILGYFISTLLFLPVTFWIFGVRPKIRGAIYGVVSGVAFYLIFVHLAKVQLPKGLLIRIFGL
jgi:hypothetical protein